MYRVWSSSSPNEEREISTFSFLRALLIKSRIINLHIYIYIYTHRLSHLIHIIRLSRRLRKLCLQSSSVIFIDSKGCAARRCIGESGALGSNRVGRDFSSLGNTWMNAHTRVTRHVPLFGWDWGLFQGSQKIISEKSLFHEERSRTVNIGCVRGDVIRAI